jgi:hypothetical protein
MYAVIVRCGQNVWTTHSTHDRRRDAQFQADIVRGNVVRLADDGTPHDGDHCPGCGGDPMLCGCETPWSSGVMWD